MIENKVFAIDDLPEEVLQYILSFLDVNSSLKAALACRKFYELICHLQRDKFIAVIDCEEVSLNFFRINSKYFHAKHRPFIYSRYQKTIVC